MIRQIGRMAASGIVALALLFVVYTPQARADDREHCKHAVERAESRLDHAIAHNGERSREAEDRRRELNAERERCWGQYHQWWNGKEHRWETEQNWDHDHDHDDHH